MSPARTRSHRSKGWLRWMSRSPASDTAIRSSAMRARRCSNLRADCDDSLAAIGGRDSGAIQSRLRVLTGTKIVASTQSANRTRARSPGRQVLWEEELAVSGGCSGRESDLVVAELPVEVRCLKGVRVDAYYRATAHRGLALGGLHEAAAEPVAACRFGHPQPLDHGVAAPREPVEAGDQLAVVIAQEAAQRPTVVVAGHRDVVRDHAIAQLRDGSLVVNVGDGQVTQGAASSWIPEL